MSQRENQTPREAADPVTTSGEMPTNQPSGPGSKPTSKPAGGSSGPVDGSGLPLKSKVKSGWWLIWAGGW